MEKREFDLLVANLKADKRLTSVPLVCPAGDAPLTEKGHSDPGALEILSGNHRVEAAIAAGIETAQVMVIKTPISRDRKVAIQLSHNAITGQDNPNVLGSLYGSLGFEDKVYTGITDEMLGVTDIDAASLGIGGPAYEELVLTFLPEDREIFMSLIEQIKKRKAPPPRLAAPLASFNLFFDALVQTKDQLNIHNTGTALVRMAELAVERLDQIEAEGGNKKP